MGRDVVMPTSEFGVTVLRSGGMALLVAFGPEWGTKLTGRSKVKAGRDSEDAGSFCPHKLVI